MKTEHKMLEYAAKACDRGLRWWNGDNGKLKWNPLTNSADCSAMCAKLDISTLWLERSVDCDVWLGPKIKQAHDGTDESKEAAWRYAATKVAAKIGGME